jgi:hypothetical protein
MALVLFDRVQQTGTANTTVSFTLSGSVTGYQSFSVVGNGNTTYYGSTDTSGNWEVGIGTYSTTGPTLARTTILSSSNSGSAVTFSGTVTVFVTYPSEKSVNLDASDNVSPLGTVASGTWQGTTIGVAYGGTGVTSSSGANSVVLRDSNQNITVNRVNQANTNTTAAGGTTALTAASSYIQTLVGTGGQTYTLPDATTVTTGVAFVFNNLATGTLTIQDYATGSIGTIPSGGAGAVFLTNNATVGGTWDLHSYLPEGVTFGTNAFNLGTAVISGGTWQGGTIQSAYGGTGLTTFAAANNALYSTSASALVAGTLPVLAGGTGQTTAAAAFNALNPMTTTGDLIYEETGAVAARLPIGTTGQILTVAGGIPTWAVNPGSTTLTNTSFTATAGQTSFSVTYTPALLQGVYRNGVKLDPADYTATSGTAIVLAIGATAGDSIQVQYFTALATSSAVNSISFGSTGLTPSTATAGAVTVAGTLAIANGGTGATTLAAANIPVTNVANTFTGLQTFAGTSSNADLKTSNIIEHTTIAATAATGTIAYDITTQSVLYYTTNASGNWTVNFRGSSGTSLNTIMATGESMSATFMVTQGATPYYNSAVQVDGSSVTPRWQGGTAPTAGNASGIDVYTYVIIKTGNAAFTVLASQTQFK